MERLFSTPVVAALLAAFLAVSGCQTKSGPGAPADAAGEYVVASTVAGGLQTPESVLHDPVADVYLVSNLAGGPFGGERKGFISRIRPDGTMEKLEWIRGGVDGVGLDAPKGMAIVGDVLWVADLTVVRKFDRTTGKPLGSVAIEGAKFLNDLSAGPDGTVYVSDSGFAKDFSSTGADAVYAIAPDGKVKTLGKGGAVKAPNGLLAAPEGLLVVTWNEGKLLRISPDGAASEIAQLPKAKLDGIVAGRDGSVLISSWEGACVYEVKPPSPAKVAAGGLRSPADIGRDVKRDRLLVPIFEENRVAILDRAAR
jgi:hypothetical protein